MAIKRMPLIDIDLGANGGHVRFRTTEEAIQWVRIELNFWDWAMQSRTADGLENAIWAPRADLNRSISILEEGGRLSASNPDAATAQFQQARSSFARVYVDRNGLPHSTTPKGQFLHSLGQRDKMSGIVAAAYLSGRPNVIINARSPAEHRGVTLAVEFESATSTAAFAESGRSAIAALEAIRIDLQARADKAVVMIQERAARADEVASQNEVFLAAQSPRFTKLDEDFTSAHTASISMTKEALNAMENAFKAEMKLRAPVAYWKTKRTVHRSTAAVLFLLVAIGFLLFGSATIAEVHSLLADTATNKPPQYWQVASVALMGLLLLWGLRLITRLFLSQLHLAGDADERITMVQTYLALLEGGNAPKADELQLVLEALFRRASDGMVRDDGMPFGFWEAVTRGAK